MKLGLSFVKTDLHNLIDASLLFVVKKATNCRKTCKKLNFIKVFLFNGLQVQIFVKYIFSVNFSIFVDASSFSIAKSCKI